MAALLPSTAHAQCTKQGECRNEYDTTTRWWYRRFWGLTALPTDFNANAVRILLEGNQIPSLPSGGFSKLHKVTYLKLDDNRIRTLFGGSFDGLVSLETLLLEKNWIDMLNPGRFFAKLTALKKLNLKDNRIRTLPASGFAGLPNLEELDLSDNAIFNINTGAFDPLYSLKKLWLNGNQLESLTSVAIFANQPRPLELRMSDQSDGTNSWDCSLTLFCWLRQEQLKKTIKMSTGYSPVCAQGGPWAELDCGTDQGEWGSRSLLSPAQTRASIFAHSGMYHCFQWNLNFCCPNHFCWPRHTRLIPRLSLTPSNSPYFHSINADLPSFGRF